jgi:thiamine transport system substrate-binding protein
MIALGTCVGLWLSMVIVWAGSPALAVDPPASLTLMSHDSFNVSQPVIDAFEKANRVKINFLKAGDAGAALNQAILSTNNPLADVFFGVDNTFLSRALSADIFEPYASPQLAKVADELKLDPQNRLLPVDFGDVCLNYDKKWFAEHTLSPPAGLADLIKPAYKGLTVVENPATSSPGLAFLLATVGKFGDPGYLDFWKQLKANDVLVVDGWESAYWGQFSAAGKGNRPIVVSYATSPPAEVHFSKVSLTEAPTAAVTTSENAFRQIEFVGILKGTRQLEVARKLVDFMLDRTFQEDIPLTMFVFPANRDAILPEVFVKFAEVAKEPAHIPAAVIAGNRERWIEAWTEAVLH